MSVRVQVILDEQEATRFRSQAKREGKSFSAWLRSAGRQRLEQQRQNLSFRDTESLSVFFRERAGAEEGREPDWEEHKRMITHGMGEGG